MHEPPRREIGYFGAARLRDGKVIYRREAGKFNAESVGKFLKQLRKASCQSGKKVAVIVNNARYHHATMLKEYLENYSDEFKPIYLSPYCPDLNPIARVWELTRRCCTHNRYNPSRESLISSVEATFDEWVGRSQILKKYAQYIHSLYIVGGERGISFSFRENAKWTRNCVPRTARHGCVTR